MAKKNIYIEFNFTMTPGSTYPLEFYPFKMQNLEVFNLTNADILAMVNDASFANAITVVANGVRTFSSDKPSFARITFFANAPSSIRVVATR